MKRFLFALSFAIFLGWFLGRQTHAKYLTAPDVDFLLLQDDPGEVGIDTTYHQWVF